MTSERLVLRDGSVAALRAADPSDREALARFFDGLSPQSRRHRFLGMAGPSRELLDRCSDTSDPEQAMTLIAFRGEGADRRLIAVASYFAIRDGEAEAAFAVAGPFHGKGLGTALLEHLAAVGARHGFRQFVATTLADNHAMLQVFHDSGFEIRSKSSEGAVEVRLSLMPSAESRAAADRRDRAATVASLRPVLEPRTVAVIGASRNPSHLGRRILDALIEGGFTGAIYPVNPQASTLAGLPCYPSAGACPAPIDLAVVAVPAAALLGVVDECGRAGVKAIVAITAGLAEVGDEGRALQDRLVEKVRACGMRLVGPNCMGVLNTDPSVRLNASFAPQLPPAGRVALSSQSGGLAVAILALATERQIGISTFVSLGNKADVSGNDLLQYGADDPRTSVLLLYLESFGNPRRFARIAGRVSRAKPIVAVKSGRTRAGTRAAGSHTASLAASETAVDALFRQAGVIRAETIDEMFDLAACLDSQPLPPGDRVAIVTNAGGPGILAADACEAARLVVSEFTKATRAWLAAFLPAAASLGNPIDMVASASPDHYRQAVEVALSAEEVDALVIIYTPIDLTRAGDTLAAIREGVAAGRRAGAGAKPVLACLMATHERPAPLRIGDETVPVYAFPENAVRALGQARAYARWRAEPPGLFWAFDDVHADEARAVCRRAIETRGTTWLSPDEARQVVSAFGLPLVPGQVANSADGAAAVAAALGFPVAVKLSARDVTHKSDIGGVHLHLTDEGAVRAAFDDIAERARRHDVAMEGVLVQPMITGGIETLVGLTVDPLFGPLVGFGLGGIHVELLGDVAFRIAPLTDRDADALLHGIRGFPLLEGYRGQPAADLDALRELLLRVSRLAEEVPEILELDFNPVLALPPGRGCRIVDARIRVGTGTT